MKHAVLHSIAHNLGDSFASGIGIMIGVYNLDIYRLAGSSANRRITCDFLSGKVIDGALDDKHLIAFRGYCAALPRLAESQGAKVSDFGALIISFWAGEQFGLGLDVEVEDRAGKRTVRTYRGLPAKTPTRLDELGRRRPVKSKRIN